MHLGSLYLTLLYLIVVSVIRASGSTPFNRQGAELLTPSRQMVNWLILWLIPPCSQAIGAFP